MTWQKAVATYIRKNVLIMESAISDTDDTKVVLLYSVSVYFCKSTVIYNMCMDRDIVHFQNVQKFKK